MPGRVCLHFNIQTLEQPLCVRVVHASPHTHTRSLFLMPTTAELHVISAWTFGTNSISCLKDLGQESKSGAGTVCCGTCLIFISWSRVTSVLLLPVKVVGMAEGVGDVLTTYSSVHKCLLACFRIHVCCWSGFEQKAEPVGVTRQRRLCSAPGISVICLRCIFFPYSGSCWESSSKYVSYSEHIPVMLLITYCLPSQSGHVVLFTQSHFRYM